MNPGVMVPLALFGLVVFVIALQCVVNIHSKEEEVRQKLLAEEMSHRQAMQELNLKLQRIKEGLS
jgi:hypothetical protein